MGFRRFWAGGWVWPQRLNAVLAAVLVVVLIVGGWGTVAASAQALPGDLLYPIKRADESLRLGLAPDEESRAQLRLDFSGRRIDEAIRLIQANRTDGLDQVLADYNDQMQSALMSLQPSSPLTPSQQQALASRMATELQRQSQSLSSVRQAAPPAAQANIDTALSSSQHAYSQATTLIQNPGGGGTLLPTPAPSVEPPTLTPTPTSTPRPIPNTPVPTLTPSPLPTSTTPPDTATPPVSYPTGTPTRTPGSNVIGVSLLTRTPGGKLTATLGIIVATVRAKLTETPRPILSTMLPPILATRLATRTTAPNSGTPPVSIIVVRTPTPTP